MNHLTRLYDSLKPLHYASVISGTIAVNPGKAKQTMTISKFCLFYNVAKALVFVGCFIYACEDIKILSDSSNNSISQATGIFDLYASITTQTTSIFLCCINAKRFIQLIHGLAKADKQLEVLRGHVDYSKSRTFVLWGVFIVILEFTVTFLTDYVLFIQDESKVYLITSYYPILTMGIVKLQIVVMMFLIAQRFQVLNRLMRNFERTKCNILNFKIDKVNVLKNESHIINVAHSIHNQLCQVCTLVNYLYGIQLVLISGSAFVIPINETYYCYTQIKENVIPNLIVDVYFSMQWAAVQVLEMYAIIFFAEKTNKQIRKITTYLHDIRNNTNNKQLTAEIYEFLLYMSHNKVGFNACGLYGLDYKFLHSMIAGITSYIIIMIQFDIAKNGSLNLRNQTYSPTTA